MDIKRRDKPYIPTIADALLNAKHYKHQTMNTKSHLSKKNKFVVDYTLCDNGSRRVPSYYLNGVRVNALGFPLTKKDYKLRKRIECKGCLSGRCYKNKYYKPTTAVKQKHKYLPGNYYPFNQKYFTGPLTTI